MCVSTVTRVGVKLCVRERGGERERERGREGEREGGEGSVCGRIQCAVRFNHCRKSGYPEVHRGTIWTVPGQACPDPVSRP